MYTNFHGEVTIHSGGLPVDAIIREYFPDYSYLGVFVDIGAYRPVELSNSYHFEQNGWSTICIEPNIKVIEELRSIRKNVLNYALADKYEDNIDFSVVYCDEVGPDYMPSFSALHVNHDLLDHYGYKVKRSEIIKVKVRTLDWVLENKLQHLSHIDVISIDTEEGEEDILKGFTLQHLMPKLFVIEQHFQNDYIENFMRQNNYHLDKSIDYNKFYLRG